MAMTLLELVLSILAKVKKPASPSKPPVTPPVAPPPLPPVQPTPPVIITPPTTTGPGPAGATPVATALSITTQPSSAATSGVPFTTQPVVQVVDQFGSPFSAVKSIGVAVATGSSILSGATPINSNSSGVATFSGIELTNADTCTLRFTSTGLTSVTSNAIVVSGGSVFPTANLMLSDWHGTTIENSGLLANGNQWTTDTPGHTNDVPQANPTGSQPWSHTLANKVIVIQYDANADSNAGILVLPDLTNTPFKLGYGSTHYVSWWVYVTSTATVGPDYLRKWLYERWNSNHGSSGDPDHVCRGFGAQVGGETDPAVGATQYLWNSNAANALFTKQAWHYMEVKTVCDSAPGSGDGNVTMWYDDVNTPILANVNIHMTSVSSPSGAAWFLDWLRIGAQLENGVTAEQRYLGPCAVSTQRIGPL